MSAAEASTTRKTVAAISRDFCRPLLKPLGFNRRGTAHWRERDGLLHDIAFQASAWGNARAGRFTINVGGTHAAMYGLCMGGGLPEQLSAARWPITQRIGFLAPGKTDLWWDVDETTDISALGAEISRVIHAYAVPFLDALSSRASVGSYLHARGWPVTQLAHLEIARALFAYCEGERAAAVALLRSRIESLGARPGAESARRVLERIEGGSMSGQ